MATYGEFPGVRVTTERGAVASVSIGSEEKLVLFGEANYDDSYQVDGDDGELSATAGKPEQINSIREAASKFGGGSELAEAMQEALQNGANINFLYGVAVPRVNVTDEAQPSQTGTLENVELVENTGMINVDDIDGSGTAVRQDLNVEFRYNGAPEEPSDTESIFINPLTGEYAAGSPADDNFEFDYTHNDFTGAFSSSEVRGIVDEAETGIYAALTDSDAVASDLSAEVSTLRDNYQLVNAFTVAEPNDNEVLEDAETTPENGGADARYDTANYDQANQSVVAEHFYKFAPGRVENEGKTVVGGVAGLFAGNGISDPVYNETVGGYQDLEQSLNKTEASELRDENVIPIRSGGTVRVKGNRSTDYGENDTAAGDFWTRRITDRVILIGKEVGENTIGLINDEDTRNAAERLIRAELVQLVQDRLIRSNEGDGTNWSVDVFEDPTNPNEVKIDIAFTPYGIVKRVDETITVSAN